MARLLHTSLALATFLLLGCTLVSSQDPPVTRLPDISIEEGSVGSNSIIVDTVSMFSRTGFLAIEIRGGEHNSLFNMYFSFQNGRIMTTQTVDRDRMAIELRRPHQPVSFDVSIHLVDFATVIETVSVILRIVDINDNIPTFPIEIAFTTFREGLPDSPRQVLPLAIDNDEGMNAVRYYTLSPQNNEDGTFGVQVRLDDQGFVSELSLVQVRNLDRETRSNYILTVTAFEGTIDPLSDTLVVIVTVLDTCDEPPQFIPGRYLTEVDENSLARPLILSSITATDTDIDPIISYRLSRVCSRVLAENTSLCMLVPLDRSPFAFDPQTRDLTLTRELDREEFAQYEVLIRAEDDCLFTGTGTVVVTVLDVNDNSPFLEVIVGNVVPEEQTTVVPVYFLSILDPDEGMFSSPSRFTFKLYDNSTGVLTNTSLFQVATTFRLRVLAVQPLDYEVATSYSLVLNATDWGTPNRSTIFQLPVTVSDVNDNSPIFEDIDEVYSITENIALTTTIITLRASDRDTVESGNGNVTYLLPQSNVFYPYQQLFSIDQSGRLTANAILDREEQNHLFVLVEARDNPDNPNSFRSGFIVVNLTLTDLNDNPPVISMPLTINVPESQASGSVIFIVTASDNDTAQHSAVAFSLTPPGLPFAVNDVTGAVTLVNSLDYEKRTNYTFTITVLDRGEPSFFSSADVTVMVIDVNEFPPQFIDTPSEPIAVSEERTVGYEVYTIRATDADGDAELLYSFAEPQPNCYLGVNNKTGVIQLKLNPGFCAMCLDILPKTSAPVPGFFIINTNISVSDGDYSILASIGFLIHNSFCTIMPSTTLPSIPQKATPTASIVAPLVIVAVLVFIFVPSGVFLGLKVKQKLKRKTGQPTDSGQSKPDSGGKSPAGGEPTSSSTLPHKVSVTRHSETGASSRKRSSKKRSSRQQSHIDPNESTLKPPLSKPSQSNDLGVVASDIVSGRSQAEHPRYYPEANTQSSPLITDINSWKAQIPASYNYSDVELENMFATSMASMMTRSEGGSEGLMAVFSKTNDSPTLSPYYADEANRRQGQTHEASYADEANRSYQGHSLSVHRDMRPSHTSNKLSKPQSAHTMSSRGIVPPLTAQRNTKSATMVNNPDSDSSETDGEDDVLFSRSNMSSYTIR